MGFIQASMLGALAAVALPVIAHLIFRRRSRPVDLGTLRFLKLVVRREARRRWLKRLVLLVLQIPGRHPPIIGRCDPPSGFWRNPVSSFASYSAGGR